MARQPFGVNRGGSQGELWERILVIAPLGVLGLLALYLVFGCMYTVDAHEQAVVLRFGKYHATRLPGLHFRIPLVDTVWKVSIEEHSLRLPFGGGSERPMAGSEGQTLMLTGDLNAASVEWTVQWKIASPTDYLFSFYREDDETYVERVITNAALSVMNRLVGDYSIDEVLTEKREEIAIAAQKATQAILDQYHCGVMVSDLQMQRVTPPEQVKPSFDKVNAAIQERDRLENEANKERNVLMPKAYAQKDSLIRQAEGYAQRRRAEATGEIEAILAKYRAYQKAPDITRKRLYLEAMEEALKTVESKVIIDSDLKHVLPLLPLEQGGMP